MSEARARATRFVAALDHYLNVRDAVRGGGMQSVPDLIRATEHLIQTSIALDTSNPPFEPGFIVPRPAAELFEDD